MSCLDENKVVEFVQGNLSVEAREAVERHIDDCVSCRQLLAELAKVSMAKISSSSTESREAPDDLLVGQVLAGRYYVAELLGQGAMGTVYEVKDLQLQDKVALKVLRPELTTMPQYLHHLRHEVVLGRRISHSNVCRLHDIGHSGDTYFITMNLVRGQSLTNFLSEGVPPVDWTISILCQICDALNAAHQQGVVHRDLKGSNIMVDSEGLVTVMDFGLALDLWGEPSQSGLLIGSPAYWSPEQARGERATERSDIYSLGVVACELFGARFPPVTGEVILNKVPGPYRSIVMRCLNQAPEKRFHSVREVKDALLTAHQKPRISPVWYWALASTVLLCIGAVLIYLIAFTAPPAPGTSTAILPPKPTPPNEARAAPLSSPAPPPVAQKAAVRSTEPDRSRPTRQRRAHRRRASGSAPGPAPKTAPETTSEIASETTSETTSEIASETTSEPPRPVDLKPLIMQLRVLEQQRMGRGILLADMSGYLSAIKDARAAIRKTDPSGSQAALHRMSQLLEATHIDKAFIARKLQRLNRLKGSRKLDEATSAKVSHAFAAVHGSFFAGDYQKANHHLNRIWRLLNPGGE